jgi:hypothetical protein
MNAFVFFAQVVAPVLVEVAVADHGADPEDGLGSVQSPSGSCDVHAVLDQTVACSLDDIGGGRPADGQRGGVVQVGLRSSRRWVARRRMLAASRAALPAESWRPCRRARFRRQGRPGRELLGGLPDLFPDLDEIAGHWHGYATAGGRGGVGVD